MVEPLKNVKINVNPRRDGTFTICFYTTKGSYVSSIVELTKEQAEKIKTGKHNIEVTYSGKGRNRVVEKILIDGTIELKL